MRGSSRMSASSPIVSGGIQPSHSAWMKCSADNRTARFSGYFGNSATIRALSSSDRGIDSFLPSSRSAIALAADQVEAELAVTALDRVVDLADRRLRPFGHVLELRDQLFHAVEHTALGGQADVWVADIDRPRRQLLEALLDDASALLQLFDANQEAIEVVALL